MKHDENITENFQTTVWAYYHSHARNNLPWRQPEANRTFDPYKVMVSEIMLQQTQVQRVTQKYQEFLTLFPSVNDLSKAELGDVLRAWSGLGYNRRAKFIHQAAQKIMNQYEGIFPHDSTELIGLPGIGTNTAGAIMAYAYNQPIAFVETNIRTTIIHHFFNDRFEVSDKEVLAVSALSLDHTHPREWYWALMDYGSYLKQTVGNLNKQSKTYAKQSKFVGSKRQLRGQVIKLLGQQSMNKKSLSQIITDGRLNTVISDLRSEALIRQLPDGRLQL